MKSALFVQINAAVNTNLTSKVSFVSPKHIYVCPVTQVSNVCWNSILTSKVPFLSPKHIAICPTTAFIYFGHQVDALDVPKWCYSTALHVLES